MQINLQDLGLSPEKIEKLVVEAVVERLMMERYLPPSDSDGDDDEPFDSKRPTTFAQRINAQVQKAIDDRVALLGEQHVIPMVSAAIDNCTLVECNKWGEKKGEPQTFTEYLVARAEVWVNELVDYQGKTKAQNDYNWKAAQGRLAWMIDQKIQYAINSALQKALADLNTSVGAALSETVRLQIQDVLARLQKKS